jgi:5-methylcytosine-specific restriction endonuclease McrA
MKHCWKCSISKPKIDFGVNKSKPDGLATECRECKRQQDREYAARNREAAKKRASEWYYSNYEYARTQQNKYTAMWKKENPDKNCAYSNKRRALKLKATPKWLTSEHFKQIESFYWLAQLQYELTDTKYHVDHIIPLKGKTVCGLHVPWNLQILTVRDNLTKGNRLAL